MTSPPQRVSPRKINRFTGKITTISRAEFCKRVPSIIFQWRFVSFRGFRPFELHEHGLPSWNEPMGPQKLIKIGRLDFFWIVVSIDGDKNSVIQNWHPKFIFCTDMMRKLGLEFHGFPGCYGDHQPQQAGDYVRFVQGSLNFTYFGGIKQCKCMVKLWDFSSILHCLGWYYNDPCCIRCLYWNHLL